MIDLVFEIYKKFKEKFDYIFVGALTTLVSLASYYICVCLFLNPQNALHLQISNIISWICAVTFAYFANRKYVFRSHSKIYKELFKFLLSRISTLFLDMLFMALFVTVLAFDDKISKIIVQFIIFILNYVFSKLFVFNR